MTHRIISCLIGVCLIMMMGCNSESDTHKITAEELMLFKTGYEALNEWKKDVGEESMNEAFIFYDTFTRPAFSPFHDFDPDEIIPLVNDIGYESSSQLHEWLVDYGLKVYRQIRDDRYNSIDQYLEALVFVSLSAEDNLSRCDQEVMVSFLSRAVNKATSYGLNTSNPNNKPPGRNLQDDSFLIGSSIHKVLLSIRDIKECN